MYKLMLAGALIWCLVANLLKNQENPYTACKPAARKAHMFWLAFARQGATSVNGMRFAAWTFCLVTPGRVSFAFYLLFGACMSQLSERRGLFAHSKGGTREQRTQQRQHCHAGTLEFRDLWEALPRVGRACTVNRASTCRLGSGGT